MYHRPVCVNCECELRPEKNGIGLLDFYSPSDEPEPQPYRIWDADLWKCPRCGCEIVIGFGQQPIAEHWKEGRLERAIDGYKKRSKVVRNFS